jgi:hypothetical protein
MQVIEKNQFIIVAAIKLISGIEIRLAEYCSGI